ncbi:MAG: hypothetical protein LBQ24_03840 [Candidatus Peribacteria bacterium]|jgi:predicted transcriptional regulator|nr:hypothetical protein [Candidatus Peribacteria bacterium]
MEFLKGESNSNIWEIHKSKSFLGITQEQLKKFAEQSNSNLKETIVFKIAFSTNLKKLYDEIIKINNDTIIANCIKNII